LDHLQEILKQGKHWHGWTEQAVEGDDPSECTNDKW